MVFIPSDSSTPIQRLIDLKRSQNPTWSNLWDKAVGGINNERFEFKTANMFKEKKMEQNY